ncbi:MAG: NAD(+) synthase, partial [Alkalispirochaeta sp.]
PIPTEEDRYRDLEAALVLGLRDYLGKTGFSRVHLGLSGGIDSAVVAVIAARAIGPERVKAFLMPSQYSSGGSITDSEELVRNLGIPSATLPILEIYNAFASVLAGEFDGTEPGIAEENIQARARGNLLMAWSNKFGSLTLTTGNKSELAVGYCTLYGDMSGGLAVIGDLLKTEVYGLAGHINRDGEVIPEEIITKAPSAELRPDQKDQDSLPPYEILDAILTRYLIHSETSTQIIDAGYDPDIVTRVLRLVGRSEYKRRQAPPVLKVSPRAFGTGRRMPIARAIYETQR